VAAPTGKLPVLHADVKRQAFVKQMLSHAWQGYRDFAWGADALRPVSKTGDNNFLHMGATAVDAMDTLLLAGMIDEYTFAEEWVLENLHFTSQQSISVFETTIRVLGGLLAAYDLTESLMPVYGVDAPLSKRRPELLARAKECADALKFAFNSQSGIPYGTASLGANQRAFNPGWTGGMSSTAEAATLQLEWEYLAMATGQQEYANLARKTMQAFHKVEPADHLLPIHINPATGQWGGSQIITLGARGDSAYEYLVKQHVMSGGLQRQRQAWRSSSKDMPANVDKVVGAWSGGLRGGSKKPVPGKWALQNHELALFDAVRSMYDGTVHGIKEILVHETTDGAAGDPLVFISERLQGRIDHKMDHLACFAGGMLGLGAQSAWGAAPPAGWSKAAYLEHANKLATNSDGSNEAELLKAQDADDMRLAAEITRTCHEMYSFTATKLAPEIVRFREHGIGQGMVGDGGIAGIGMVVDPGAKHCLLRPEAVESFFVMFRLTGDERYREWGWEVAQAIEAKARIESGGYSSLRDVTADPPSYKDHQESFFLAETLKYLYLLFSDSELIPLDQFVFNTEAHPLRIARSQ
jgi:mannosyl-oligosaccharide alpha-1,2-mannosidase